MKTLIIRACFIIGVLALLAPGTALAAKEYAADRFDVNVVVQPGGSLLVTETVVFRFVGGPFTFVFRELPTAYTDGITNIQATLDGVRLPTGTVAGQVEITGTDPIRVQWHFAPTSDSTHAFGLTYHALGVVKQETNADALYWQALPNAYEYGIDSSTVTVMWQDTQAKLVGAPQVTQGSASIESRASQATFAAQDLKANSPLLLALHYERGSLITAPPQWQARAAETQARLQEAQARQAQLAPFFILAAALVFVCGSLSLFFYWKPYRRETSLASSGGFYPNRPPDDLPPAIAGALNGNQPAWSNALAALFDLAQRGVIRIDELPGQGWFRSRDFGLTLLSESEDLRPHERGLLAILFENKKGKQTTVKLSQVSRNLNTQWKKFAEPLKQEMQTLGLSDPVRRQGRVRLNIASGILIFAGVVGFVGSLALIRDLGGWFVLIPLSVVGVAIVGFVLTLGLSPLSEQGSHQAARWQEFYKYMRNVVSGKEPAFRNDLFELYLPYASSYGLAEEWAKYFKKHGGSQIPSWFHALAASGPGNDGAMSAFIAMTGATSSAGGDGGAVGAGAGAAGGGASGAG